MAKIINCPHLAGFGMSSYCLNGKFPVDCEKCDCKEKKYMEITADFAASASLDDDQL